MAYYNNPKSTFKNLIDSVKSDISKSYLKCKQIEWWGDNNSNESYVEQWLYNRSHDEIRDELRGYVQGYLKNYDTVEIVCINREILPKLAMIYEEMCKENSWEEDENLQDWRFELELLTVKQS